MCTSAATNKRIASRPESAIRRCGRIALTTLRNQPCPTAREKYPPLGAVVGARAEPSTGAPNWLIWSFWYLQRDSDYGIVPPRRLATHVRGDQWEVSDQHWPGELAVELLAQLPDVCLPQTADGANRKLAKLMCAAPTSWDDSYPLHVALCWRWIAGVGRRLLARRPGRCPHEVSPPVLVGKSRGGAGECSVAPPDSGSCSSWTGTFGFAAKRKTSVTTVSVIRSI